MNCEAIGRLLSKAPAELAPGAQEHIDGCERCAGLQAFVQGDSGGGALSNELREQIGNQITAQLSPASPLPPASILVWRTIAVFVFLPAIALLLLRPAAFSASPWHVLIMLGIIASGEIALSLALCSEMVPGCHPRIAARVRLSGAGVVWLAGIIVLFPTAENVLPDWDDLPCLIAGLLLAVPAGVALWTFARMGAVLSWNSAGMTIGWLAGSTGLSMLTLHCDILNVQHQAFWHGSVLLLSTLIGWTLGTIASANSHSRS